MYYKDEDVTSNESIEPDLSKDQIRQDPYSLPAGFVWDTLDLEDAKVVIIIPLILGVVLKLKLKTKTDSTYISFQLKELYTLLNENYVEDDDCLFRFDYPPEFLKWYCFP